MGTTLLILFMDKDILFGLLEIPGENMACMRYNVIIIAICYHRTANMKR